MQGFEHQISRRWMDMRGIVKAGGTLLLFAGIATSANATETVTYTYDALGRLVTTAHSGSVNSGLQAGYTYDAADNRTNVVVTGAPAGNGTRVIVVPLNGFTVIALPAGT
jgi:YD repeat-containing protein